MNRRRAPAAALVAVLCGAGLAHAVNVQQACTVQPCFSGVVAACGSCFPTTAAGFCKSPCQPTWGGLDTITCLGQAGDSFWLTNVQSLNVKCGLPPIPNASAAGGAASPDAISSGLGATVGATVATPPVVAPAAPQTTIITGGNSGSLSAGAPPADATGASTSAAAEGQAQGAAVAAAANAEAAAQKAAEARAAAAAARAGVVDGTGSGSLTPGGNGAGATTAAGAVGTGGTAVAEGGTVSSAVASFSCAVNVRGLNLNTTSSCVMSITASNACTQPCATQFQTMSPECRNAMVQDSFYGKTWQGIFTACRVSYDMAGPAVKNAAASLSSSPAVTSAATATDLVGAVPPDQAAVSTMVLSSLPLIVAALAAAALL